MAAQRWNNNQRIAYSAPPINFHEYYHSDHPLPRSYSARRQSVALRRALKQFYRPHTGGKLNDDGSGERSRSGSTPGYDLPSRSRTI